MIKTLSTATIALFFTVSFVSNLPGAPLVHESFDYEAGTANLTGQNGGGGFTGAWVGTNSASVAAPGLNFTGLATTGNRANFGGNDQNIRDLNLAGFQDNGDTLWLSVLAQVTSPTTGGQFFESLELRDGGTRKMSIRKGVNQNNWALGLVSGNTLFDSTNDDASDLSWLVMRIDFKAGDDDVYLWVNPDPTSEPLIGAADAFEDGENFTFDSILVRSESSVTGTVDEIRIATNFADLSASLVVPEPSSLAIWTLIGLALAGLSYLRKNRSEQAHP